LTWPRLRAKGASTLPRTSWSISGDAGATAGAWGSMIYPSTTMRSRPITLLI